MRFFEDLSQWWLKRNGRNWGSGCARVMRSSPTPSVGPVRIEPFRVPIGSRASALLTRANWKRFDETTLIYHPSGQTVEMAGGLGVVHAIHSVIEIEYEYLLSRRPALFISWRGWIWFALPTMPQMNL